MALRTVFFLKVVVASVAVVALVAIPAKAMAPSLSLAGLVICIAAAFGALVVLTACSLQVAQFILRKGGTDPQWFWFRGEPPGLAQLRQERKAAAREL